MDESVFQKMKAKPGMTASVFNPPEGYPQSAGLHWASGRGADFVHLFVKSGEQLEDVFPEAANTAKENALFWVSYPKASGKQRYDINRDRLWDLLIPKGWHPVAQVSLDDQWSAVRVKPNEAGKSYVRPNKRET